MPDSDQLDDIAGAIASYRKQLDLVASTTMGRPNLIPRSLEHLAATVRDMFDRTGVRKIPRKADLDFVHDDPHDQHGRPRPTPGRFEPGSNKQFLRTHRNNLASFERSLKKLRARP